jgi:hypothetical protein
MANDPFRNSPERPAREDLQGKASWDPEGSSQAHKALRDKVKEIDKRDCVIIYDAALAALQKEIHQPEQAIQSKEKKDQEKQFNVYLEASNRIRSAVQGNIHEVRKNIETLLEEGEASQKKQTEQSDANLTEGELVAIKAAEALKGPLLDIFETYRMKVADQEMKLVDIHRRSKLAADASRLYNEILSESYPDVVKAFRGVEYLHQRAMNNEDVSDTEHRKAFENLLGLVSVPALEEFKERQVAFVLRRGASKDFRPVVKRNGDQWQLQIPLPYKYGINGLVVRTIDTLNRVRRLQDRGAPTREQRVQITTWAFLANERLGQYKFSVTGYPRAMWYQEECVNFIYEGVIDGSLHTKMSKGALLEKGYMHAHTQYLEYIQEHRFYPSVQPGAFFEECSIWELYQGQEPAILGTEEYDAQAQESAARRQRKENSAYAVNIQWGNKDSHVIFLQHYYVVEEGLQSRHPINVDGGESLFVGIVDIDEEKKVIVRMKDQSGHFMSYDQANPGDAVYRALKVFQDQGYDTSTTLVELTTIEGAKVLPSSNYTPPDFFDLQDAGWLTPSEKHILGHGKMQQEKTGIETEAMKEVRKRRDHRIIAYQKRRKSRS